MRDHKPRNSYCEELRVNPIPLKDLTAMGIRKPSQMLMAALLHLGCPTTLEQVAALLEDAGVGAKNDILMSLKKAKPAATPFFRVDDTYGLDATKIEAYIIARAMGLEPEPRLKSERPPEFSYDPKIGVVYPQAKTTCAVVYGFPENNPQILIVINWATRETFTFIGNDITTKGVEKLNSYSSIAALHARQLAANLGIPLDNKVWIDLSDHAKSLVISKTGRKISITTELLIQSSCGISKPLGDHKSMKKMLDENDMSRLKTRAVQNAKSLYWFFNFAQLHGHLLVNQGSVQEFARAKFIDFWERISLHAIFEKAIEEKLFVEVVYRSSLNWKDPWENTQHCIAELSAPYEYDLFTLPGDWINADYVQLVRLHDPNNGRTFQEKPLEEKTVEPPAASSLGIRHLRLVRND